MRVTLIVLTFLGAQLPCAFDHPSTQAAAPVALILPPGKLNHTQGLLWYPDKNLSPTW